MRELADSIALTEDAAALRARLREDGCLLLRGLLDRERVLEVRAAVTGALAATAWTREGTDPLDAHPGPAAVREGQPGYDDMYTAVQSLEAFHALAHEAPLRRVAGALLGEPPLVIPLKILRASLPDDPGFFTPPHQDYPLIQGSVDVLTAWMPLGDVPLGMGGLRVLLGSHRQGLRSTVAAHGTGGVGAEGVSADDPRWATAAYRAGDVLMFHSLTVHASSPNDTDRLRLSVDYRYQSAGDVLTDFLLEPHHAPSVPGHDVLCRGWSTRRWVAAPAGLRLVARLDSMGPLAPQPSRLLRQDGARAAHA